MVISFFQKSTYKFKLGSWDNTIFCAGVCLFVCLFLGWHFFSVYLLSDNIQTSDFVFLSTSYLTLILKFHSPQDFFFLDGNLNTTLSKNHRLQVTFGKIQSHQLNSHSNQPPVITNRFCCDLNFILQLLVPPPPTQ